MHITFTKFWVVYIYKSGYIAHRSINKEEAGTAARGGGILGAILSTLFTFNIFVGEHFLRFHKSNTEGSHAHSRARAEIPKLSRPILAKEHYVCSPLGASALNLSRMLNEIFTFYIGVALLALSKRILQCKSLHSHGCTCVRQRVTCILSFKIHFLFPLARRALSQWTATAETMSLNVLHERKRIFTIFGRLCGFV